MKSFKRDLELEWQILVAKRNAMNVFAEIRCQAEKEDAKVVLVNGNQKLFSEITAITTITAISAIYVISG